MLKSKGEQAVYKDALKWLQEKSRSDNAIAEKFAEAISTTYDMTVELQQRIFLDKLFKGPSYVQ